MDKLHYKIEIKNNRDILCRAFNVLFVIRQFLFCCFVYKCHWEKTNQKQLLCLLPDDIVPSLSHCFLCHWLVGRDLSFALFIRDSH